MYTLKKMFDKCLATFIVGWWEKLINFGVYHKYLGKVSLTWIRMTLHFIFMTITCQFLRLIDRINFFLEPRGGLFTSIEWRGWHKGIWGIRGRSITGRRDNTLREKEKYFGRGKLWKDRKEVKLWGIL